MRDRLPPLTALPMFEAAGRHQNFRLAAEELNISQGAVAQQVRKLEQYLGQALFIRQARGLALTKAGQAYHQQIGTALGDILQASEAVRGQTQTLTLSLTPSLASKWLMPRLADFTGLHPHIEVKIMATEALTHFERDDVDLAIRLTKPPFANSLEAEHLLPSHLMAYGAPSLLARIPQPLGENGWELMNDVILLNDAHNHWPDFLAQIAQDRQHELSEGNQRSPRMTQVSHLHFNQTALAIEAAVAGQGLVLAPQVLVERELTLGSLKPASSVVLMQESAFYLIYPKRAKPMPALQVMLAWLKDMAT